MFGWFQIVYLCHLKEQQWYSKKHQLSNILPGRILHFLLGLLHQTIPTRTVRTKVASLSEETSKTDSPFPRLHRRQRPLVVDGRRFDCSVEQRGSPVGQHVDGERDHLDQLDQVAAHDRSAVAGHQVDQEQVIFVFFFLTYLTFLLCVSCLTCFTCLTSLILFVLLILIFLLFLFM